MENSIFNKINRYTKREIEQSAELFDFMYYDAKGFVKIMCGTNRRGYFYNPDSLSDLEKLEAILNSRRFTQNNLYVSMATFTTMEHATKQNILNVCALAIDVDYTLYSDQESITYREARNALENAILDGFPKPTYIEYSRNMRLVYIIKEPYIIPKTKKAADCIKFLERTTACLSDKLNQHSEYINFNATPQRLTSFVRIPYSINKRSYGHYDFEQKSYVIDRTDTYSVNIEPVHECWDIQKLSEAVLPPLFDGYEEWKKKSKVKKANKVIPIKATSICERRLKELKELQARGYDKGYRESLCYLYWVTKKQTGATKEEAIDAVKQYNKQFKIPLDEHRLMTDCKPSPYIDGKTKKHCEGWERHFKDNYIRNLLGLGSAEPDLFKGEGMTNSERCKNYYNRKISGQTKQQQIENRVKQVSILRAEGKKWKEVAELLGVSELTAKNYGSRLKEKSSCQKT